VTGLGRRQPCALVEFGNVDGAGGACMSRWECLDCLSGQKVFDEEFLRISKFLYYLANPSRDPSGSLFEDEGSWTAAARGACARNNKYVWGLCIGALIIGCMSLTKVGVLIVTLMREGEAAPNEVVRVARSQQRRHTVAALAEESGDGAVFMR